MSTEEALRLADDIVSGIGSDRDGWYGAAEARVLAAALREAQAENERLREFAETTEEWAYEQGFDGLAERARAALAASAPADEAKP